MAGPAGADLFVGRFVVLAAHITRNHGLDALQLQEGSLQAPETAAGQSGGFESVVVCFLFHAVQLHLKSLLEFQAGCAALIQVFNCANYNGRLGMDKPASSP